MHEGTLSELSTPPDVIGDQNQSKQFRPNQWEEEESSVQRKRRTRSVYLFLEDLYNRWLPLPQRCSNGCNEFPS